MLLILLKRCLKINKVMRQIFLPLSLLENRYETKT